MLADFHPKGGMADSYGLYHDDKGITDRATVLIDTEGIVRWSESAGLGGLRKAADLLTHCQALGGSGSADAAADGARPVLYYQPNCGFCQRVLGAITNLNIGDKIDMKNIHESGDHEQALTKLAGDAKVPTLAIDGKPMRESEAIIKWLADRYGA